MPASLGNGVLRTLDHAQKWSVLEILWFCAGIWNNTFTLSDTELSISKTWYPGDAIARGALQDEKSAAGSLAHNLLDCLLDAREKRAVRLRLHKKTSILLQVLKRWFFPCHMASVRTCAHLECLLSVLMAVRGLLWMLDNPHNKHTFALLRVLPHEEAQAALQMPNTFQAWASLVDKQRLLCAESAPAVSDNFGLYQLFSDSWRYVGIGRWCRPTKPGQPGLSRRLIEHMFATYRRRHPEADKLRYRLCRSIPSQRLFFLVCRTGPEQHIRALETLEIRTHCPQGNGRRGDAGLGKPRGHRRRPPQNIRGRPKGPLNCLDAPNFASQLSSLERCFSLGERVPQEENTMHNVVDLWSFSAIYATAQQHVLATYGCTGPLWICDPAHWFLLLAYAATRSALLPWA